VSSAKVGDSGRQSRGCTDDFADLLSFGVLKDSSKGGK